MKNQLLFKPVCLVVFLIVILLNTKSFAQNYQSGPQVLSFHSYVDDTEQPYGLYLPENYDTGKKYPFVVMLHGAGSNHRLGLRRVFGKSNAEGESDVEASRYFPKWNPQNYIVASVFARGTIGYQGIAEKDVMDMIRDVKQRFSVDEDRTYLTGLSMGGGGALWLGLSYPDLWAAIAPVCPAPPQGTKMLVSNALNFPVHIFQGGDDPVVKTEGVREWVDLFKKKGVDINYMEYPGVQHDSWVNAYKDESIFDWFGQFKRNPFPDRVNFKTDEYSHDKAYWVRFESFTPGILASIDAQFKNQNHIIVQTNKLQSFTLELNGHPKFQNRNLLKIEIDSQFFSTIGKGTLTFSRKANKWMVGTDKTIGLIKKKGAEGPMMEAINSRHVYVYGTEGNPSKEELESRKEQAEKAANWSFYRGEFMGRIMIFPRVLSDKEVRPSDHENANLILFGDENTNFVIAKFQDQLPMRLSDNKESHGLAYIFPQGDHYVLINSGLSIMDAPKIDKVKDWLALPPIYYALKRFEDFVLFDKEKILINGRFDNSWQLQEESKFKMRESGIVAF